MSAYISIITPESGFLFTDAARYDQDGVLRAIGRKVKTAKTAPFAVTTRGNQFLGDKLQALFCDITDLHGVDAFIDGALPELLTSFKETWFREIATGHGAVQVHFVAWSESRGPIHASFHTIEMADRPSIVPFELDTLGSVSIGGPIPSETGLAALRQKDPEEAWAVYCGYVGTSLMELMREAPAEMTYQSNDDPARYHLVGGHVDLTIVTPDGAKTETVKVWHDKVDQLIAP